MKKTIRDFDLYNKKVIIRADFNVPIKDGIITDDNRIKESLPTINYALEHGAKVILMSHLGRIKCKEDLEKNNLEIVSKKLSDLLNKDVIFCNETRGINLENSITNMKQGDIILIQNTRYEDLDGKKESSNDEELGKYWASLGDIFINDAFGTCHRAHASNVGISTYLPSGIGFLVEKELKSFDSVINNPEHPFTVILGGSKVSDKIGVTLNLVKKADYILIGGGMSFTFLRAKGYNIGKSLLDEDSIDFCTNILNDYPNKTIIPIDIVETNEISNNSDYNITDVSKIDENKIGVDIGPKTIALFKEYIETSKLVVWNGPVGIFEYDHFASGTKELCKILSSLDATTIIGGGDTAAAVIKYGYKDKVTHVSTGGGASLELLEGKNLPGIEAIDNI